MLLLLACVPPSPPEVADFAGWPIDPAFTGDVEIRGAVVDYYEVVGRDDVELLGSIRRLGPHVGDDARGAATTWDVRWAYPADGRCAAEDIHVTASLAVTFPRWTPPPDAPARSVGNWQRYVRALAEHEQGHVDATLAIVERMAGVLAEGGCTEVDARGRDALEVIRQANAEYDRVTQVGATQGAVLFVPNRG